MGILDYLILAGIAVGILAAVRHLKRNQGCGGCGGDCSHCKKGIFLSSVHFFFLRKSRRKKFAIFHK